MLMRQTYTMTSAKLCGTAHDVTGYFALQIFLTKGKENVPNFKTLFEGPFFHLLWLLTKLTLLVTLSLFVLFTQQGEYLQIDLGVVRQVQHIALQGRPESSDFVKTFYLRYGNNGLDFNNYGANATVKYKVKNDRFF